MKVETEQVKNMVFSVLLVGAGQLGSRYLQGFVRSKSALNITVVDPLRDALEVSRARWIEAGGDESSHQIRWVKALPAHIESIDIAFIVTSSKGRTELIERIAGRVRVHFWVLEKLLAQSSSDLERIGSAVASPAESWVNTPRRMMRWHANLKKVFSGRGPLTVTYSAGRWGLACNSIHFIDLVAWWSGESLVSVDVSGLANEWIESKRLGYFEVTGELVARFSSGTVLRLKSYGGVVAQPIRVQLADDTIWEVDEPAGIATSPGERAIYGKVEYQSQLSGRLIEDILVRGQCVLPTLEESSEMHTIFLDAVLGHWNYSQNRNDRFVPIT